MCNQNPVFLSHISENEASKAKNSLKHRAQGDRFLAGHLSSGDQNNLKLHAVEQLLWVRKCASSCECSYRLCILIHAQGAVRAVLLIL